MKKLLCILALLLALVCVFAACDDDTPSGDTNTPNIEQNGGGGDQNTTHTHSFGEWSVSKAATCGAKGEEKRTCACGESETREIAATGEHTYGEWSVSKVATCVAKGEEKRTCDCGESETREIAMCDHTFGNGACTICAATDGLVYIRVGNEFIVKSIGSAMATDIIIPTYYEGYPVTSIAEEAFRGCEFLESIKIPFLIANIGKHAFFKCESLEAVLFDFGSCLTTIESGAFRECESLISIEIPEGVTSIEGRAFELCESLTSIVIPASVVVLGFEAFDECISLSSIVFEPGCQITRFPSGVFRETAITDIKIPRSVTSIGYEAFCGCSMLAAVNFESNSNLQSIETEAFWGCDLLSQIEFPESVNQIERNAVERCGAIEIENGVSYVDKWVVDCDESIIHVSLRNDTVGIVDDAFRKCNFLQTIEIPDSVKTIGDFAFSGCTSLNYTIYNNGEYLGNSQNPHLYLYNVIDTNITNFTIHDATKIIGNCAIADCTLLASITIPDSVKSIGSDAFRNCTSLMNVYITDLTKWCNIAFNGWRSNPLCNGANLCLNNTIITDLEIPSTVTQINDYTFHGCNSITSVIVSESVISIGENVFRGCGGLTSVIIPGSVMYIGVDAFSECTRLVSAEFENTITWIVTYDSNDSVDIYASELTNLETAAKYLTYHFDGYRWNRAEKR